MTEQHKHFPEFYVTAAQPCPYLPGKLERKLFTHLTRDKSAENIDNLLRSGFRRSQNIAYMPYCEGCHACVSVRVVIGDFEPGRSMRRTAELNRDLVAQRITAVPTSDQFRLFRKYIEARHPGGGMADMGVLDFAMMVEDSVITTFISEYRMKPESPLDSDFESWPLLAVALCDQLSDGISMVYSFFDPDLEDRGLGTHMILDHIEFTRRLGLPYLYLGYWIEGSRKMDYKRRYQPQEHLGPSGWTKK